MRIVAIDTDSKGSIAVICTETKKVDMYYIPATTQALSNGKKRAKLLRQTLAKYAAEIFEWPIDFVYFEEQWSRPDQDAGATFTFGCVYCSIVQAFEDAAFHAGSTAEFKYASGQKWKKTMFLNSDKSEAVKMASRIFPKCVPAWEKASTTAKSSGEFTSAAEAALLAFYALTLEMSKVGYKPHISTFTQYGLNLVTPKRITSE